MSVGAHADGVVPALAGSLRARGVRRRAVVALSKLEESRVNDLRTSITQGMSENREKKRQWSSSILAKGSRVDLDKHGPTAWQILRWDFRSHPPGSGLARPVGARQRWFS